MQADDPAVEQIPDGQRRRQRLPEHGRNGRAHHAPLADEQKDRVEDDIHDGPGQRGEHGKARTAIGADHRVHGLSEHIKRDAERDPEEIFLRKAERLVIHPSAENSQKRIAQQQVDRHQDKARGHGQHNGISRAARGVLRPPLPETQADEGAAAVADHDGDGQRDDRHREGDGIGRIAERAEVGSIGDEDLIDNVIQRADQQRYDARHRITTHELSDRCFRQKAMFRVFHTKTSSKMQKKNA